MIKLPSDWRITVIPFVDQVYFDCENRHEQIQNNQKYEKGMEDKRREEGKALTRTSYEVLN